MIKNWNELNAILNKLSEDEVKSTLLEEVAGAKRGTFVKRLHQRYCALRASRERKELKALVAGTSDNPHLPPAATIPSQGLDAPAVAQG